MITVCLQLLSQFWMFVPSPDKLPESEWSAWLFVIHLSIGVIALCFVAVRLMSIMEDESDAKRLYPWTDIESFKSFWFELKTVPSWFKQGPPAPESDSRLAAAVHGLGLLLVLALGITGILFYLGLAPDGAMDVMTALFRSIHEYLAIILWLYMAGHVGMFLRHRMRGLDKIRDIFTFKNEG